MIPTHSQHGRRWYRLRRHYARPVERPLTVGPDVTADAPPPGGAMGQGAQRRVEHETDDYGPGRKSERRLYRYTAFLSYRQPFIYSWLTTATIGIYFKVAVGLYRSGHSQQRLVTFAACHLIIPLNFLPFVRQYFINFMTMYKKYHLIAT